MDFSPKTPEDSEYFGFNYARQLGTAETIVSAAWTSSVQVGTDGSAQAMISGSAVISGSLVQQLIVGGSIDTQYCLVCKATTDRPQTLVLAADVWVRGACG